MNKRFRPLHFFLVFCLTAGLLAFPVFAQEAQTTEAEVSPDITVTVRAESSMPGSVKTMLPTKVTLKVDESNPPTVYNAMDAASKGAFEAEESDFGMFLTGLIGVSDETGAYSWMYAVNNKLAEVSIDKYELKDGDKIDFYFISWQEGDYAYFTPDALTVDAGEAFTLNLKGVDFTDGEYPVEGAMLSIASDAPTTRELNYTDENGNVTLSFFAAGEYLISASKQNGDGVDTVSHPLSIITVEDAEAWADESVNENAAEEGTDSEEAEREGSIGFPSLENIQPMPMPTPAVTYSADNNTLNVYGTDVDITGLQVISENGELYLPLRAVAEALGAAVEWDGEASVVSIALADSSRIVQLFVSQELENGTVKFVDNRVYVPSAFVIQHFGE